MAEGLQHTRAMGDDETTVNSQYLPSPITDDVPSKQLPEELIVDILLKLPEIYGEVLLPRHDDADNVRSTHLSVLSDCLCVSFDYKTHWTVWMMKEYGVAESWTKLMIIPQQEFKLIWKPLFMSENGAVLVRTMRTAGSTLVRYDLNNGQIDCLAILVNLGKVIIHHESLISPQR
ncbi:uncharacterized protein [Medicago truncatula]|uniref:uncharacterized protein isoform X2 n=1 Tax=Medicago truncatula TaxID=3880 RepID=UPI000D2F2F83|nr:uncharacterized protein LOC25485037 isoform X2 [Medicago truncatula]